MIKCESCFCKQFGNAGLYCEDVYWCSNENSHNYLALLLDEDQYLEKSIFYIDGCEDGYEIDEELWKAING